MARIRSIKPEFPQSESMGNISRDARLSFILLWTLADDSGRLRGNSRMLASLLFPYDDDAPPRIDGWLAELEREGCILRYKVDDQSYVQICNWLNHQKIDKPSKSKLPEFDESSRILANPREGSSGDQRIKDQGREGKGEDQDQHQQKISRPETLAAKPEAKGRRGTRLPDNWEPTESLRSWAKEECPDVDLRFATDEFRDYWVATPGQKGCKLDWDGTWRNRIRELSRRLPRIGKPTGHVNRQLALEQENQRVLQEWLGNDSAVFEGEVVNANH